MCRRWRLSLSETGEITMTRDEAVKVARENIGRHAWSSERFVECLVALGMLKLTEPKNANIAFIEQLPGMLLAKTDRGFANCQYIVGTEDAVILLQAIDQLGLRVVYKENAPNCK
jgi:hypothetical protein